VCGHFNWYAKQLSCLPNENRHGSATGQLVSLLGYEELYAVI